MDNIIIKLIVEKPEFVVDLKVDRPSIKYSELVNNMFKGEQGIQGIQGETGNGIESIVKSSSDGLVDIYTILFTNGETQTFNITNGADGKDGKDGLNGKDGADGKDATIVGLTVNVDNTTGTPSATATMGGTPNERTFRINFSGLKGEQGKDGVIGRDGKSAYDYALDGGYTGSEQDFANELSNIATKDFVEENGGKIDSISVNGTPQTITNKNVNIKVPTDNKELTNSANFITKEVNNLNNYTLTTETGSKLGLSINNDYLMTIQLLDKNDNVIDTKTLDFPIESMVVNASYSNGIITLVLQNGTELPVNVSALVKGLVSDTRKINGKELKEDIELTAEDVGVPEWARESTKPKYDYSEIENTPDIPEGSTVDAELSTTSTNAVQNKVITSKINEISLSLQNTSNKANSNEQSLSGLSQNINLLNTNKANNDASNLSELNVTAWKEKLNIGGGLLLGLLVPSTCFQDDAGLHYADGSELMFGGIYDAFCRYVSNNRSRFPVVDLATYNQKISTYGQCGSYVITDTYVKLPRIVEFTASNNGGQQIGSEELDSFKSHNHTITKSHPFNTSASGNYTSGTSVDGEDTANKVTTTELTGGNETKPKNVRYPYYIVVGTVTKTDIEVDINKYISDLNNLSNQVQNKAQSDLSNVANTTLKNKALGLTTLWSGSQTGTGTLSLAQSFLNFNFLYIWGRNSGNEYASWIVSTNNFNSSTSTYPYDCGNNTKDANRYVNLYKASNTSITIKSIGSMTLLGVYGL